jgi:hypothetical protein
MLGRSKIITVKGHGKCVVSIRRARNFVRIFLNPIGQIRREDRRRRVFTGK